MSAPPPPPQDYTADNVQVLRGMEHVRRRPAMYLGSTDAAGLHRLLLLLVESALEEVRAGLCSRIAVVLNADGSACVEDNGQGIPVQPADAEGRSVLELLFTEPFVPRLPPGRDRLAPGLHGLMSPGMVSALSAWLAVEVHRDGFAWRQRYARGRAVGSLVQAEPSDRTGTSIAFRPDPTIFSATDFDYRRLAERLFELACTNPGLGLALFDLRSSRHDVFLTPNGIEAYLPRLVGQVPTLTPVVRVAGRQDDVEFEAVLRYVDDDEERIVSFVNCHQTPQGTHLAGFRPGLARAFFNQEALVAEAGWEATELAAPDLRAGLRAVMAVRLPDPQWYGAARNYLNNPEVEGTVTAITARGLSDFLTQHPEAGRVIWRKGLTSSRQRTAALEARRQARPRPRRSDR
jgi:DNA gyrase subunit B